MLMLWLMLLSFCVEKITIAPELSFTKKVYVVISFIQLMMLIFLSTLMLLLTKKKLLCDIDVIVNVVVDVIVGGFSRCFPWPRKSCWWLMTTCAWMPWGADKSSLSNVAPAPTWSGTLIWRWLITNTHTHTHIVTHLLSHILYTHCYKYVTIQTQIDTHFIKFTHSHC